MKFYHVTKGGYIYDKRIFWGALGLTILFFLFIGVQERFNFKYEFYFNCKYDVCENPLYTTDVYNSITGYDYKTNCLEPWCSQKLLPRGEYGKPPNPFIKLFPIISMLLVILAVPINHLVHNKGRPCEVKLNLSDKFLAKIKNITEEIKDDKD